MKASRLPLSALVLPSACRNRWKRLLTSASCLAIAAAVS